MFQRLILSAALMTGFNAFATGAYSCKVVDHPDIKFSLALSVSHGMGSPILNATGTVRVNPTDGAPAKSVYKIGKQSIPQYWNNDGAFNLGIYAERAGAANSTESVTVLIKTDFDEKASAYKGKFSIEYNWFEKTGWKSWKATDLDVICEEVG